MVQSLAHQASQLTGLSPVIDSTFMEGVSNRRDIGGELKAHTAVDRQPGVKTGLFVALSWRCRNGLTKPLITLK